MQFNNDFIGYTPNTVLKFCGSDNEDRFNKNLKTQPKDWYYRNVDITYEYNENGHRCKNISEIDLDNYILFSGCSYVEGIGLALENTLPYLMSSELNMDYYNLALGGSGIDTMTYNLIQWFNNVKKLPKAVIIIWSFPTRFLLVEPKSINFVLPNNSERNLLHFMVMGDKLKYFNSKKILNAKMIRSCYRETKVIELETTDMVRFDLARDLGHYGIVSQHRLAKDIIKKLK